MARQTPRVVWRCKEGGVPDENLRDGLPARCVGEEVSIASFPHRNLMSLFNLGNIKKSGTKIRRLEPQLLHIKREFYTD